MYVFGIDLPLTFVLLVIFILQLLCLFMLYLLNRDILR